MLDVRGSIGITFTIMALSLFPAPLRSSIKPPLAGEEAAVQSEETSPVSQAADTRIFSGSFVARGEISRGTCRWAETWTFSAVSFDLGRKTADFSYRLIQNPSFGCIAGDRTISHPGVPLTVNGNSVRASATWGAYQISITSTISGQFLHGTFAATPISLWSGTDSGVFKLAAPGISLTRNGLLSITATGSPPGGRFSYSARRTAGTNAAGIAPAQGVDPAANPNKAELKNPSNPNSNGSPAQGGLAEITATYTKEGQLRKTFSVATFGLSCYNNALEEEWGTPPAHCRSLVVNHVTYSGSITDPNGFKGIFCYSFIKQVRVQGSGRTRDGRKVQYEPTTDLIREVQEYHGAEGTPVVAGRTVARDLKVIPKGVRVDISGVGESLLANDTGDPTRINAYRIDVFMGPGEAVCKNYPNNIAIVACQPGNAKCPARNIPE